MPLKLYVINVAWWALPLIVGWKFPHVVVVISKGSSVPIFWVTSVTFHIAKIVDIHPNRFFGLVGSSICIFLLWNSFLTYFSTAYSVTISHFSSNWYRRKPYRKICQVKALQVPCFLNRTLINFWRPRSNATRPYTISAMFCFYSKAYVIRLRKHTFSCSHGCAIWSQSCGPWQWMCNSNHRRRHLS